MNWREWPQGAEEYGDDTEHFPDRNKCPVCHTALRPVEIVSILADNTTFYTTLCPKCRTQYFRDAMADEVIINPEAENITELEERVRTLEETLSRLIAWIRTQQQEQPQPKAIQERPTGTDDTEDFKRKYHYLL